MAYSGPFDYVKFIESDNDFNSVDWETPDMVALFARGLVLRGKKILSTGANLRIGAFGTGNLPVLINSTEISTAWTNVAGNVWSTSLAVAPYNLFERTDYTKEGLTKLIQNTGTPTTPGTGQWGHASGTLYVYSSTDPNTKHYENAGYSADSTIRVKSSGTIIQHLGILCADRNGIIYDDGVNGSTVQYCDVVGATNDGIDGSITANLPKNILIQNCNLWDIGYGAFGANASGDGVSFHGNTPGTDYFSVTVQDCDIRRCTKGGVTNQSQGQTKILRNYIEDCWNGAWVLGNPTDGNLTSDYNFYKIHGNVIRQKASGMYRGINITDGGVVNSPIRVEAYNNTIDGLVANGREGIFITNCSRYTLNIRNNILTNHAKGISDTFNTANIEALDYNSVYGCTTNYYDNGTGNLVAKVGAHSLTSDPEFVSSTDYHLQETSPCFNAGTNVGLTTDKDGVSLPQAAGYDIGAYELNDITITDTDVQAIISAMTTPPDLTHKILIRDMVGSLKSAGVWSKLDTLWVMAAADSQAAGLNLKNPSANTLSLIGSPTFTADRGYTGNGSNAGLNGNYNPGDGGTYNLKRDDACLGVWNLTSSTAGATADTGGYTTTGLSIRSFYTGSVVSSRVNVASGVSSSNTVASAVGHTLARRNSSSTIDIFRNGSALNTGIASTSSSVKNVSMYLLGYNVNGTLTNPSPRQMAACHYGAYLDNTEVTALYNALNTYLTGVGAV